MSGAQLQGNTAAPAKPPAHPIHQTVSAGQQQLNTVAAAQLARRALNTTLHNEARAAPIDANTATSCSAAPGRIRASSTPFHPQHPQLHPEKPDAAGLHGAAGTLGDAVTRGDAQQQPQGNSRTQVPVLTAAAVDDAVAAATGLRSSSNSSRKGAPPFEWMTTSQRAPSGQLLLSQAADASTTDTPQHSSQNGGYPAPTQQADKLNWHAARVLVAHLQAMQAEQGVLTAGDGSDGGSSRESLLKQLIVAHLAAQQHQMAKQLLEQQRAQVRRFALPQTSCETACLGVPVGTGVLVASSGSCQSVCGHLRALTGFVSVHQGRAVEPRASGASVTF